MIHRRIWHILLTLSLLTLALLSLCTPRAETIAYAGDAPEPQFRLAFRRNGAWMTQDGAGIILSESAKKGGTVKVNKEQELWHYSGNYWNITHRFLYDSEIESQYSNFNDLVSAYTYPIDVPLPAEVKEKIAAGKKFVVAIRVGEGLDGFGPLDIDRLFYTEAGSSVAEYTLKTNWLTIWLPIKFNFMRQDPNSNSSDVITLQQVSERIAAESGNGNTVRQSGVGFPIPDHGYGRLLGAIRTGGGRDVGGHSIVFSQNGDFMYSAPYTTPPANPKEPWWLGHLRMLGSNAVLDSMFDGEIVHRADGAEYTGGNISVGDGTFAGKGAVGSMFYFPLEIEFYIEDSGNLSIPETDAIDSANPGDEIRLDFAVSSTYEDDVTVDYEITRTEGPGSSGSSGSSGSTTGSLTVYPGDVTAVPAFYFIMPENDVTVTFTLHPRDESLEEADISDNTAVVHIKAAKPVAVTGSITLDYNVLTQDESFYLGAATATLVLPDRTNARWTGPATGSLTVTNKTPALYHNLKVNGKRGDSVVISVISNSETISVSPFITTTITRDWLNYHDEPTSGRYGSKDVQNSIGPQTGTITATGSVSRPYEFERWVMSREPDINGGWVDTSHYETRTGIRTANFSNVSNVKSIVVKVYNGIAAITPAVKLYDRIDGNTPSGQSTHLWWAGSSIRLTAVRPMGDMSAVFTERAQPVTGQYIRDFAGQDETAVIWAVAADARGRPLSMANAYQPDRDRSKARNYNVSGAERAVFASDKGFSGLPFPIRSGYFFNPAGTYTFTVTTSIYSSSPDATGEHAELVDALIASFRYESDMTYINASRQAVMINGATAKRSGSDYAPAAGYATVTGSPLFKISVERVYSIDAAELRHNYTEAGTDIRLKSFLEGYDESGTRGSMSAYKYIEYVSNGDRVYNVTESTTVTIRVNPDNQRVYTHPQMKNGDYTVRAYFADVGLGALSSFGYNAAIGRMTLVGVSAIDKINLKVVGSIYEDAR